MSTLGFTENGTIASYAPGVKPPGGEAAIVNVAAAAQAIATALEEAAIADWDRDDGDGKCIEIYVSQIAPIVERVLREGGQ
jgi:hypothetical protein